MNPSPFQDWLKALDVPDIAMPRHQKRLRAALIHAHWQKQRHQEWPSLFLSSFVSMFTHYKWQFLSVALLFVAALVLASGIMPLSPQAYAKSVVHNIIFHLNELSPDEREVVRDRMAADIATALQEAQDASDLRVIPVKDFEKEMWNMHESMKGLYPDMDFPNDPPMLHYSLVQILRYTDVQGKIVTIGIDNENIPVMKMVGLNHADYLQFENGVVPEDHLKLVP